MAKITECIIIGGGKSIEKAVSLSVGARLNDKLVIVCNFAYKHFPHTFLAFQDREFYVPDYAKNYPDKNTVRHPDIYEELRLLPLIVGINNNGIEEFKLDNTILLDKKERENLTGVFALKLAERIMESGTIYLLGFDFSRRTGLPERDPKYNPYGIDNLHYYNDIKHRGTNFYGFYENHPADKEFAKLIKKDITIYNVSLESNINCFPKISYEKMYTLLNNEKCEQEEMRKEIKEKLI